MVEKQELLVKSLEELLENFLNELDERFNKKRWLTPEDLEKEYGFKKSTISKRRMNHTIPYHKIGQYIRYDRYKIDKFIEDNEIAIGK